MQAEMESLDGQGLERRQVLLDDDTCPPGHSALLRVSFNHQAPLTLSIIPI